MTPQLQHSSTGICWNVAIFFFWRRWGPERRGRRGIPDCGWLTDAKQWDGSPTSPQSWLPTAAHWSPRPEVQLPEFDISILPAWHWDLPKLCWLQKNNPGRDGDAWNLELDQPQILRGWSGCLPLFITQKEMPNIFPYMAKTTITLTKHLYGFYWVTDKLLGVEIYIKGSLWFHCKGLFGKESWFGWLKEEKESTLPLTGQ